MRHRIADLTMSAGKTFRQATYTTCALAKIVTTSTTEAAEYMRADWIIPSITFHNTEVEVALDL